MGATVVCMWQSLSQSSQTGLEIQQHIKYIANKDRRQSEAIWNDTKISGESSQQNSRLSRKAV